VKLLVVTPFFPWPADTGARIIALHHVRGLVGRGHVVDLVARCDAPVVDTGELGALCRRLACVAAPSPPVAIARGVAGLLAGGPWEVARYSSGPMSDAVQRFVADGGYDAVLFQLSHTIQFRPATYAGPCLLAMEDPLVLKHRRMAKESSPLRRAWLLWRAALLRRYEQAWVPGFDRVLIISRKDLDDCRRSDPKSRYEWVPYGIDLEAFPFAPRQGRDERTIIITGNMYRRPNIRAVTRFCEEILPRVLERVPDARLRIVGARPAREVARWASHPAIEVTGAVPDVAAYLRRATVSVCAVDLMLGTQTKVLEAMASGTPVVTTTAGNHGIEGISGRHLHVADDPMLFADLVIGLLRSEGWDSMATEGRRWVEETLSWSVALTRLEEVLTTVLAERDGQRDTS
jgi:polysaccharide biosynthesis protein PslH